MKKKLITGILVMATLAMTSGCGFSLEREAVQITPTPVPIEANAATPTPAPTVTPLPTVTSAPRMIGKKTEGAGTIYFVNNSNNILRELYIKSSASDEWGESIIMKEYSVKKAEKVQMYYPVSAESGSSYDMRIVDGNKNIYEIYGVNLGDMEQATFKVMESEGYLTYMSLSENSEKTTTGYTQQSSYDETYSSDYNETYYNETYYNYDSYDSYYDNTYDNTYYDNDYNYNENYYNYDSGYGTYTENVYYY